MGYVTVATCKSQKDGEECGKRGERDVGRTGGDRKEGRKYSQDRRRQEGRTYSQDRRRQEGRTYSQVRSVK